MQEFKIDYAFISCDQNPEYKSLSKYTIRRWNDLGVKVVYIDLYPEKTARREMSDDFGNVIVQDTIPYQDRNLCRHFSTMIYRFYETTRKKYENKVCVISDADLIPINKRYIFQPKYGLDMYHEIHRNRNLITTCIYPDGRPLATYVYGLGKSFQRYLNFPNIRLLMDHCSEVSFKLGRMYLTDEEYMSHLYDTISDNPVRDTVIKLKNRKWLGQYQEMSNLYDYQIPYLERPVDLAPFIEFHNMRESTMDSERWEKLFKLLEEFDKYEIPPSNYYWETIVDPWVDTVITKNGKLLIDA